MILRKAEMKDVKELNWLLTLLIRDEKKYDSSINEKFEVQNMYENYIDDSNKCLLVAEENERIIGYLYGIINKTEEVKNDNVAYLDALYIDPEYRKKGIGNALIDAFKKWCINNNIKSIEVKLWTNNTEAKKLYEKVGFETIKEIKEMKL